MYHSNQHSKIPLVTCSTHVGCCLESTHSSVVERWIAASQESCDDYLFCCLRPRQESEGSYHHDGKRANHTLQVQSAGPLISGKKCFGGYCRPFRVNWTGQVCPRCQSAAPEYDKETTASLLHRAIQSKECSPRQCHRCWGILHRVFWRCQCQRPVSSKNINKKNVTPNPGGTNEQMKAGGCQQPRSCSGSHSGCSGEIVAKGGGPHDATGDHQVVAEAPATCARQPI